MAQKTIGGLPAASTISDTDKLMIEQGGVTKSATRTLALEGVIRTTTVQSAATALGSLANGTVIIVNNNRTIGTILGIDHQLTSGSLTATWQIADQDGSNATNITGLASLSVTTALSEPAATAANTMQITGAADRRLQLVIASLSGSGTLLLTPRYTRA